MLPHRDTVMGLFGDPPRARDAIAALKDAGLAAEDISLLMPDRAEAAGLAAETGARADGGAALGAGVGAIAGALAGLGIPEDDARHYEQAVRGGQTLVAVRAQTRWLDEAERILRRFEARAVTRSRRSISDGDVGGPLDYEPLQRSGADRGEIARPTVGSSTTPERDWVAWVPRHRAAWPGSSAMTWGEVEPYYRYLHARRHQPEYRDRGWDEVERELRREWESRYPDRPWDRAAAALRETWESMTEPARRASY
jgi:hypothetical protein